VLLRTRGARSASRTLLLISIHRPASRTASLPE
jgi:hypothetical protein